MKIYQPYDPTYHTKHHTISELVDHPLAESLGIDNTPKGIYADNLYSMLDWLEWLQRIYVPTLPAEEQSTFAITILSGYRCKALNDAMGGHPQSWHLDGTAVDFTLGSRDANRRLFEWLEGKKKATRGRKIYWGMLVDHNDYEYMEITYTANNKYNVRQTSHQ